MVGFCRLDAKQRPAFQAHWRMRLPHRVGTGICSSSCTARMHASRRASENFQKLDLRAQVVPAEPEVATAAAQQHAILHLSGAGIDAPQPSDLFYRLIIKACFFVGGRGSDSAAEILAAEQYLAARPDPLRADAPTLVATFNRERIEDVLRIGAFAVGCPIEQTYGSQLLWIDQLGVYLSVLTSRDEVPQVVRVTFQRQVLDERDARSVLTLLAQVAWERERNYIPPVPAAQAP